MKTAPDPKDVQEFQFKQSCMPQVLDAFTSVPSACNLLAADKKRGLIYAGQNSKIIIIKPGEDSDPEWKIEFDVSIAVSKLMLNCDCSYLAVAPHGPMIFIYDAQTLAKSSLQLLYQIRISSSDANVFVNDLRWNPAMPGMLCTVASDYTIGSFKIKEKKEKAIELKALEKFNDIDAMCAAWSPKGKQIVVGCKNGNIIQFKPDLKVARTIPGPNPYIGEIISILWISNYQFCAAYLGSEQRINVLIIDAPKGETNAIFTCYEDITYGMTDAETQGTVPCYYFDHVPEWGLIIAASSNSSEIAVLGSQDDGNTWCQWQLVDSGRAELPLIRTTESYPVGLAIDKSPVRKLPWGAESTLPNPVPILHILATSGQLCSFHMVNLTPNCPAINCPPTEIIGTPPQARATIAPDTSLVMNGAITSTPRPKQSENIPERSKPIPPGNIFNKLVDGNNLFAPSLAEKPKIQQEQKPPENNTAAMKLEPAKEIHPQTAMKPVKLTPIKETVVQEPVEQKPSPDDDARDIRAYLEEHNLFERELRNRLEPQTWECGTEAERRKLIDTSFVIDQFLRELRETTNSLSSDIAYLKALLLQSFAWVEETKSKNAATNDISTRSCGDSNKVSDLQKLYYYTQTQLSQASKILDLEWSDHKSHERSRMKIPHLEFIYQNLILHNKIIQEEKGKVEHLKKRWKLITRNNNIFGLNRSLSNLSIASSKSSATLPRNAGIIEARCKAIASKTVCFTHEKENKLREHLSISNPKVIKPVNPSPIQHRLEATLSSLAARKNTNIEAKAKMEQPAVKQTPVSKQQTIEKAEQQSQSPLASLDGIVARIGASETNNVPTQNKTQGKQPSFGITLSTTPPTKPVQAEKKSVAPAIPAVTQSVKPKQDAVTFNQVSTPMSTLPNLLKSFTKADTITFGTQSQKYDENSAPKYNTPKDVGMSNAKSESVPGTNTFKLDRNLFGTNSLKEALTLDASTEKAQTVALNTGPKFGMPVPATTTVSKSDAASTFIFATRTAPEPVSTSPSQNVSIAFPLTSKQSFFFASKPANTTTPFNLKVTQSTTTTAIPQPQDGLNLSTYKPTFGTTTFPMLLGQNAPGGNQISISPVSEASKDAAPSLVVTTPSLTIEKVPAPESKAPSLPTSSVQSTPASSAVPIFGGQSSTPYISMFGGTSCNVSTASTFTVTTTTPSVQNTTPVPSLSGFSISAVASTAPSTVTTPTTTVSPFQTSLSEPTFGESPINLTTTSASNITPVTSSTLGFGNVATTTAASFFAKPALTMNTQFQSAPATIASTFGKPVINPPSMSFPSSTNTSIFGQVPTSTSTASIFSGSNTTSIFGGNTQASSAGSIFGGNTSAINTFGTPQKSIFDNSAPKSESIFSTPTNTGTTSFFGGANATSPGLASPGSPSVFGSPAPNASPIGVEQPVLGAQPAFGQAPAFNTKPVFGSPPTFGPPKAVFGSGFGAKTFGASATVPAFGSPPTMGGAAAPVDNNMSKVFGNVGGSNTFESLASQPGGLSFSSLAQNNADTPKSPVFTTGSSFSTWR